MKELAESLKNEDTSHFLYKPLTDKAWAWWVTEYGNRFYIIRLGISRYALPTLSAWEHSFMVPVGRRTREIDDEIEKAGLSEEFKIDFWETSKLARTVLFGYRRAEEEFSDMYYAAEEVRDIYTENPY